jgi:hypothetical protein
MHSHTPTRTAILPSSFPPAFLRLSLQPFFVLPPVFHVTSLLHPTLSLALRSYDDDLVDEEGAYADEGAYAKEEFADDSYCMDECGGVMKDLPWLDGFKCV